MSSNSGSDGSLSTGGGEGVEEAVAIRVGLFGGRGTIVDTGAVETLMFSLRPRATVGSGGGTNTTLLFALCLVKFRLLLFAWLSLAKLSPYSALKMKKK